MNLDYFSNKSSFVCWNVLESVYIDFLRLIYNAMLRMLIY